MKSIEASNIQELYPAILFEIFQYFGHLITLVGNLLEKDCFASNLRPEINQRNISTHETTQKLISNDSSIEFNRNLPKSYLKLVLKMLSPSKTMNYDKKIQPCSFTGFFLFFFFSLCTTKLRAFFVMRQLHDCVLRDFFYEI